MPSHRRSGPKRGRRDSSPRSSSAENSFPKKPRVPSAPGKTSKPRKRDGKKSSDIDRDSRPASRSSSKPGIFRGERRDHNKRGDSTDKHFDSGNAPKKSRYNTEGRDEKRGYKKSRSQNSDRPTRSPKDSRPGREGDSHASRVRSDKPYSRPSHEGKSGDVRRTGPTERSGRPSDNRRKPKPVDHDRRKSREPRDIRGRNIDPAGSESLLGSGKTRLNKYIANSGVCSRREADELIRMGLISVNGKTITELGYKVNPGDEVRHESKVLRAEKPVYILMNKPKGFLTTTADPQERNTVMHLVAGHVKERVYPVGRLDRNTTGLLLLTNDGDLAEKLMHPSYNVRKIYKVDLDRPLTKADAQHVLEGVRLEEGRAIVDDLAIISEDRKTVGLEIHIGWNRVVRRIFESLGYVVVKLDRSAYAGLTKKDISRGEWRFLKKEELVLLKHFK